MKEDQEFEPDEEGESRITEKREHKDDLVEVPVSEETKRRIGELLKQLHAQGENVKNEDDVITYLLKHLTV